MDKKVSTQILIWILVWSTGLGAVVAHFIHIEMGAKQSPVSTYFGTVLGDTAATMDIEALYGIGLAIILVGFAFCLWLSLRFSIKRILSNFNAAAESLSDKDNKKKEHPAQPGAKDKQSRVRDDQLQALHLLCLLQREGRLVDFLEEDLKSYDDAQIGAAVRSIQETCQKSLNEYLALKAVIDEEEGEEVTIQAGFDANAVKLTGNVTGDPPFKGILQHRGWKATKLTLPTLSGTQDPSIVAPAEVEIA